MFKQYIKADYVVAAEFTEESAVDLMRKVGGSVHFKYDGTVREGDVGSTGVMIGDLVTPDGKVIRSYEEWEAIND